MSVDYNVGAAYGIVVSSESGIASEIVAAYCDQPDAYIEDIGIGFKRDYPSIAFDVSLDNWSDSIKRNVIFYIKSTFKNINPRDTSYDAFYTRELEPDEESKQELGKFVSRFGIDAEPGVCIWASLY